jgi:hypothetical protein
MIDMKNFSVRLVLLLGLCTSIFYSCSDKDEVNPSGSKSSKGSVKIYLTDAPLDAANVAGVYIKLTQVEVNGPSGWKTISSKHQTLNLLEFQSGLSTLLTSAELDTGKYTEVRIVLDVAEQGKEKANEGCFLKFKDNTGAGLFVPSGAETGYKLKGEFKIESNKEVSITIDFDARKSVHSTGNNGKYMLKPVVRMVVNKDVGTIQGKFGRFSLYDNVSVFAYRAGTYTSSETEETEFNPRFSNAVNSMSVDASGNFKIAFLPAGQYDLYVAAFFSDGTLIDVVDIKTGVSVAVQQTTTVTL